MVKIKKIKQKLNDLKQFIVLNLIEIFFIIGLIFISTATFMINIIAGLYIIGAILIMLSLILLRPPKMKGR